MDTTESLVKKWLGAIWQQKSADVDKDRVKKIIE